MTGGYGGAQGHSSMRHGTHYDRPPHVTDTDLQVQVLMVNPSMRVVCVNPRYHRGNNATETTDPVS